MEDESIKNYIGRISKIIASIRYLSGSKRDDEGIWKILKILSPPSKKTTQMIQLVMPCTKGFTKETFLRRLESVEVEMR